MRLLLDTVIVIDYLRDIPEAVEFIDENWDAAAISVITRAEVLVGVPPDDWAQVDRFVDAFPLLPIDRDAADLAAETRRIYRWKLPDAFQAALAQIHVLKLVTRNKKDFHPDHHDFVVVPYDV